MKARQLDIVEGSEALRRFDALVGSVLSVSREELLRREAEYKKKAALNPRKRGPKPKRAASHGPDVAPRV